MADGFACRGTIFRCRRCPTYQNWWCGGWATGQMTTTSRSRWRKKTKLDEERKLPATRRHIGVRNHSLGSRNVRPSDRQPASSLTTTRTTVHGLRRPEERSETRGSVNNVSRRPDWKLINSTADRSPELLNVLTSTIVNYRSRSYSVEPERNFGTRKKRLIYLFVALNFFVSVGIRIGVRTFNLVIIYYVITWWNNIA